EDVAQTSGQAHIGGHGKAQADGVAGGGVGVLSHDEYAYVVEGLLEGTQHVVPGGQVGTSLGDFLAQEISHRGDLGGDRLQRLGPAAVHDFFQVPCRHGQNTSLLRR